MFYPSPLVLFSGLSLLLLARWMRSVAKAPLGADEISGNWFIPELILILSLLLGGAVLFVFAQIDQELFYQKLIRYFSMGVMTGASLSSLGWYFSNRPDSKLWFQKLFGLFGQVQFMLAFSVVYLILFCTLETVVRQYFVSSRRRKQRQLLMIMTLAVREGLPLHQELERFANIKPYGKTGSLLLQIGYKLLVRKLLFRMLLIILPRYIRTDNQKILLIAELLRTGHSLGESLGMVPGLFPETLVARISLAEELGTLPAELERETIKYLSPEKNWRTLSPIATILSITIMAALGYKDYLRRNVIPKFHKIFEDFHRQDLISYSDNTLLFLPLFALGCVFYREIYLNNGNYAWLTRAWTKQEIAPTLLRLLGICTEAKMELPKGLKTLQQTEWGLPIRGSLAEFTRKIETGAELSSALYEMGFIAAREAQVIASANLLSQTLFDTADRLETESRHQSTLLSAAFIPCVVLTLGLYIGVQIRDTLYPMLQITLPMTLE